MLSVLNARFVDLSQKPYFSGYFLKSKIRQVLNGTWKGQGAKLVFVEVDLLLALTTSWPRLQGMAICHEEKAVPCSAPN